LRGVEIVMECPKKKATHRMEHALIGVVRDTTSVNIIRGDARSQTAGVEQRCTARTKVVVSAATCPMREPCSEGRVQETTLTDKVGSTPRNREKVKGAMRSVKTTMLDSGSISRKGGVDLRDMIGLGEVALATHNPACTEAPYAEWPSPVAKRYITTKDTPPRTQPLHEATYGPKQIAFGGSSSFPGLVRRLRLSRVDSWVTVEVNEHGDAGGVGEDVKRPRRTGVEIFGHTRPGIVTEDLGPESRD
jgi:hypothetical protein